MKTWKKAGLTALAGSLVATSAFAGAMTVSGSANLTYTANSGAQDTGSAGAIVPGADGSRWGMNKTISFAGSGEMDNGWTISVSHSLVDGGSTGIGLTLDMGDAGTLDYQGDAGGARGISKIKDMTSSLLFMWFSDKEKPYPATHDQKHQHQKASPQNHRV